MIRNSDLDKIFKIQEEAIDSQETTQKAIMHKMLKSKKVSPNTYHTKQHNLEVWVNLKKEKLTKQKKDFKNVFQNTIEIINNTNKNKEIIMEVLSKSQLKRPGIWSDYSKSRRSFNSSYQSEIEEVNVSMCQNQLQILSINSNDYSQNSFLFLGENKRLNDESMESQNSGLFDVKRKLKEKIKEFTDRQNEKVNKEVEIEFPLVQEDKIPKLEIEDKVEILWNNVPEERSGVGIETPDDKIMLTPSFSQDENKSNIIDRVNKQIEHKEEELSWEIEKDNNEQHRYKRYVKAIDEQIDNLESPKWSYSIETPSKEVSEVEKDDETSGSAKRISIKSINPEKIIKNPAIEEIKVQSKWLESYLQKDKESHIHDDESIPSDVEAIHFGYEGKVIYEEDDTPSAHTPEAILDGPLSEQIKSQFETINGDNETPRDSKWYHNEAESDMDEIPVISYSDDEVVAQENNIGSMIESKETESDGISDSEDEINIKNSDIITTETPPSLSPEINEKDKQSDTITNDLFYQILAEVISEPVPKRDLSVFTLQPQVSSRKLIDPSKKKEFELMAIEKYLEEVIESIMENESNFIDNLLEPVRKNPIEMLQLLQNSDLGSYEHFENVSLKQPVLNLDLYLDIERNKEEQRLTDQADKIMKNHIEEDFEPQEATTDDEDKIEFEQIHRKMVFDWINESINKYQPYGEDGVPMPWSSSTRRLCSNDILNFKKIFNGIKNSLWKWGGTQAGVMPTTDFMIENEFDEDLFADTRERNLGI